MKTRLLPSHFLEKIDPRDRREMGKAGLTPAEVQVKVQAKEERKLRNRCLSFCHRHDLWVGTAADYKKSTYTKGWTDLTIILPGRVLFMELKSEEGELSSEQVDFMIYLIQNCHFHYVVRSYEQFLAIMRHYLGHSLS